MVSIQSSLSPPCLCRVCVCWYMYVCFVLQPSLQCSTSHDNHFRFGGTLALCEQNAKQCEATYISAWLLGSFPGSVTFENKFFFLVGNKSISRVGLKPCHKIGENGATYTHMHIHTHYYIFGTLHIFFFFDCSINILGGASINVFGG